jgi:hypothetical protein
MSEMPLRALSNPAESSPVDSSALPVTTLATPVDAASQAVEPTLRDHELLAAVLPHDVPGADIRDAPLPMHSGVRDLTPWCYDR